MDPAFMIYIFFIIIFFKVVNCLLVFSKVPAHCCQIDENSFLNLLVCVCLFVSVWYMYVHTPK